MYIRQCLFFFCFASGLVVAQVDTYLKSQYDSIIALDTNHRDELVADFFTKNKHHSDQLELALCYHEYSKKLYRTAIDKAIRYAKQAITIRTKYQDTSAVSKSLYALGHYYTVKGNYSKSVKTYNKLLEFGERNNLIAKTSNRLGVIYTEIGDFDKAKDNFIKAEQYFKQNDKSVLLFRNHLRLSELYGRMNWSNDKEIVYHLNQADSLLPYISISYLDRIRLNQISGNLYDEREDYERAIIYHRKALEISCEMEDSSYISMNYNNLGISYKKLKNYKKALANYDLALLYAYNEPEIKAIINDNLGDYYAAQFQFKQALLHYHKAIHYTLLGKESGTYTVLPDIEHLKISPYKLDLLNYITDYANGWIAYYKHEHRKEYLQKALEAFEIADQLVDIIRFESTEFQSKLFWRARSADLYMKAVQVCYKLNRPKNAFYFMEKNKALLLLEDLTQEKAKENAQLPDRLSDREFDLRRSIYLAEEQLKEADMATSMRLDSLRDIVYTRKKEYENFIDSLETGYPSYYRYKQKLQIASYGTLKGKQDESSPITLYYILNDTEGYGLFISENKEYFFKIKEVKELHHHIVALRKKLGHPFYTKEEFLSFQELSNTIYNTLFPNIDPGLFTDKNMIVVPDHHLQQIPFEVLMTSSSDNTSYLLNQCNISYAYSLSFLQLNEEVIRTPTKDFIGFAPVQFKDTTLVDLSRSKAEIEEVASLFSGEVYDHKNASKDNFMTTVSNYNIVHLSTHADVSEKTDPWIAFYDDKLSLDELYATKNQADLVVLSACNTSLGELKTGEGVMSLARGFFSTGTRSVISTLWSANEKSTHDIMSGFYTYLKEGSTKTEAIQKAKRTYLQNHSGVEASPYYWAAPILIGNTDTVTIKSDLPCYLIGVVVFVLLFAFILWKYKNNMKKAL
ncbi:CHAT domain-containing protein [Aquimarina sp. 2201CG1-2-11]|uniref:CHAT domain-containing protein n=1 Tax=Aquimarina discodermiae TaxID=3231043 RepID=UPI0034630E2D